MENIKRGTFLKSLATILAAPSLLTKVNVEKPLPIEKPLKEFGTNNKPLRLGDVVRFNSGVQAVCTSMALGVPTFKTLFRDEELPTNKSNYSIVCNAYLEK